MWRVERSRGIGEKASKKRRAIVGIGLVVEERRKTVRMEERKNRVGGEGRVVVGREEGQSQRDDGRVNEKKKRRGEGKRGGSRWKRTPRGDQWAAASFGGVCVRVSAEERPRCAPPCDPPGFAHTQDFGGESLKSGDQDAIGRSGSHV